MRVWSIHVDKERLVASHTTIVIFNNFIHGNSNDFGACDANYIYGVLLG